MHAQATIQVAVEPDEDRFHAYCPGLPGLHVDGGTEEEAFELIVPLIHLYLESMEKHGERLTNREGVVVKEEKAYPAVRGVNIPYAVHLG